MSLNTKLKYEEAFVRVTALRHTIAEGIDQKLTTSPDWAVIAELQLVARDMQEIADRLLNQGEFAK